jgi:cytoskeleton protein RodZ
LSGIGLQLKETRESLGLSLEELQQTTKIHIQYLRAMESDQFDTLPSPFYARAFLRTYAHSLGVDAQPLLERYDRLTGGGKPVKREPAQNTMERRGRPSTNTQRFRMEPRLGRTYSTRSQRMAPPQPNRQPSRGQAYQYTQRLKTGALNQQATGRFRTVKQPQLPSSGQQGRENVPQTTQRYLPAASPAQRGVSQNTQQMDALSQTSSFTPRRVALEAKRGMEETARKAKKAATRKWIVGVAAIGALLLVPIGGYYMFMGGSNSAQQASDKQDQVNMASQDDGDSVANAKVPQTTTLTKVETGEDLEGDLYELKGANDLKVEIKAVKGECQLQYGYGVNQEEERFTLEIGEKKQIEGKDLIWFRLSKPSNVEIKVSGQEIDTTAQDVAKSYRIKKK